MRGNPIFGSVEPCDLLETRSSYITQVNQSWFCSSSKLQRNWEGPLFGVQKANVFTARKWDCCSDLLAKNGAALPKSNTFASVTEWQDSGEHGCWLKVSSPACMSPVFAKAPCCLELFGCCCRRLSQHGVGEVLIPLRQCWRDAFSVFAFALLSFVLVSWCVVCFWAPPSPP